MNKLYDKITWHNDTTPALNETNLNKMSKAIDDIDDRVVLLADDVFEQIPQIQAYLEQADDLVEALELMTANPPYIGANGHWYTWDTSQEAYVDSGIDASITVQIADVTAIAPDATPYVINTGTDTDPIFHLFIPRGQTGADGADGDDGFSPVVTITPITGGHRVNITDAEHPGGQNFDVMDGATQDISGKADKVSNATNGNFAGLNANGNLTDSGKKASDFLPSSTPIPDEVTANPTGTATGTLTKLGIGSDIYDIQGGGGGTDENAYHIGDTAETALADDDYFPFYDTSANAKRKTLWSNIKSVLSNLFAKKTDIAPVETGTTASQAYAVGQQFYLNGSLYKAKAAIAQGAAFTIGTNCELADCLTKQIKASLFPLISEMTTPTIINNRVKDVVGGYKQIGKTVYVDVECKLNQTMAFTDNTFPHLTTWGLFSNLPIPAHDTGLDVSVWDGNNTWWAAFSNIRPNGYLYLCGNAMTLNTGDKIYIRGTYEAN